MKPQAAVTSSLFPAALAVASISLALLLLPGGGTSVRSAGVAPALRLVAGDVVAAVKPPVQVAEHAKPKPTVHHAAATVARAPVRTRAAVISPPKRAATAPAHHSSPRPAPTSSPRAQSHAGTQPPAAAPVVTKHGNGNGHAYGRSKKTGPPGHSPSAPGHSASAPGHSGVAHGNPHGLPPRQAENAQRPGDQGDSHGHGGGK